MQEGKSQRFWLSGNFRALLAYSAFLLKARICTFHYCCFCFPCWPFAPRGLPFSTRLCLFFFLFFLFFVPGDHHRDFTLILASSAVDTHRTFWYSSTTRTSRAFFSSTRPSSSTLARPKRSTAGPLLQSTSSWFTTGKPTSARRTCSRVPATTLPSVP